MIDEHLKFELFLSLVTHRTLIRLLVSFIPAQRSSTYGVGVLTSIQVALGQDSSRRETSQYCFS
jgi:hypothetical protein